MIDSTTQKYIAAPTWEEEKKETAELGMWVFLASEVLFFGGLFLVYFVYRYWYPQGFVAGGRESDLGSGLLNTLILLTSSLCTTFGVDAAYQDKKRRGLFSLFIVGALGMIFLAIKTHEYINKFHHGLYPGAFLPGQNPPSGMEMFFSLYFVMTGLHALHMIVGLGILAWLLTITLRNQRILDVALRLEIFGLYWHFVDIIWMLLFPLFYLVGRHP